MVDERTIFGGLMTNIGEAKRTKNIAEGKPWKIVRMVVGDANGTDCVPARDQEQLINQRYGNKLNQLYPDPNDPQVLIAEMIMPSDIGGWWVRELGLIDQDDDLVAVANCPPSFKPIWSQGSGRIQTIRMHLLFPSTANVQLINDYSQVLVTRSFLASYAVKLGTPTRGVPGTYLISAGKNIPEYALRCPIRPTTLLRKAYPQLYAAITQRFYVETESESTWLHVLDAGRFIEIGDPVSGRGIQPGTTVVDIVPYHNRIVIDRPAFETNQVMLTSAPWGSGDGKTTFGMPWFAEDTPLLQANRRLGTFTSGSPMSHEHVVDIDTGGQSQGHSHSVKDPGHAHLMPGNSGMGNSGRGDTLNQIASPRNAATNPASTGISIGANNTDHFHKVLGNTGNSGGQHNLPAGTRSRILVWY